MTIRIITDSNGRKHITNERLLHPPQRTWVGLTDEEISQMGLNNYRQVVRETEAKLKAKNS